MDANILSQKAGFIHPDCRDQLLLGNLPRTRVLDPLTLSALVEAFQSALELLETSPVTEKVVSFIVYAFRSLEPQVKVSALCRFASHTKSKLEAGILLVSALHDENPGVYCKAAQLALADPSLLCAEASSLIFSNSSLIKDSTNDLSAIFGKPWIERIRCLIDTIPATVPNHFRTFLARFALDEFSNSQSRDFSDTANRVLTVIAYGRLGPTQLGKIWNEFDPKQKAFLVEMMLPLSELDGDAEHPAEWISDEPRFSEDSRHSNPSDTPLSLSSCVSALLASTNAEEVIRGLNAIICSPDIACKDAPTRLPVYRLCCSENPEIRELAVHILCFEGTAGFGAIRRIMEDASNPSNSESAIEMRDLAGKLLEQLDIELTEYTGRTNSDDDLKTPKLRIFVED